MRPSNVKALYSRRHELKERLVQWNSNKRSEGRQSELRASREETGAAASTAPYALIATEFQCDVTDPAVVDFLLEIEEELRVEQLVALYDDSYTDDWEAYYKHHTGQGV